MRKTRKALSVLAAVALAVVCMPTVPTFAAPTAIATYDFENGTAGMSDTGYGKAPTVTQDAERGNVLLFHDGTPSEYQTQQSHPDIITKQYDSEVAPGTPSSMKLDSNPFAGKSLTGATIAMWVKAPAAAAEAGSALVGFKSARVENREHPDHKPDSATDICGYYVWGCTTAAYDDAFMTTPLMQFSGILSNGLWLNDYDCFFQNNADKWVYMVVTLGNNMADNHVYMNGQDITGENLDINKRFNHGEKNGGTPGNTEEPLMMEILCQSTTEAFVGFTGFCGTTEGVMIDDLTFYDSIASASDAAAMYAAAQSGSASGSGNAGSNANSGSSGNDANTSSDGAGSGSGSSGSGSSSSNKTSGSAASNKTGSTGNANNQNLPQTGVVSTGLLVAGGAAAVAAGAILFKKKEDAE